MEDDAASARQPEGDASGDAALTDAALTDAALTDAALTDALDLPLVVLDGDLRLKRYSPPATKLFELAPSDVEHPFSRVVGSVEDSLFGDVRRAMASDESIQREMQTGGRWYVMRVMPYREQGETAGAVLLFFDVTERKRTEKNLRESEVRLRLLMENLDEYAIFTLDVEGKITSWNAAAEQLFQYGESEVIGRIGSILYTAEDRNRNVPQAHLDEARQSGQAMDYRWVIRKDGSRFWAYGVTVALYDNDDRMRGYARVVRDTSEGKNSQEKLARVKEESERSQQEAEASRRRAEEARAEAERANQAKSQFLANMSHELRTPLNSIIGYSDMLLEDMDEQEDAESIADLNRVLGSGRHLLSLVNDVLDLSKIEAGRMELSLTDFAVEDVVREVAGTVRPRIEGNESRLEVEIEEDLGTMHADETKLRQSLGNLLSNAAKFTEGGTVTLGVRRERRDGRQGLVFDVADTGIGMTDKEQENLFEAFEQASEETSREYGGTGLGLAITRNVCRLMGGSIEMESEKGVGTTFTIWLPSKVTEEDSEASAPGMTGRMNRPSSGPASGSASGPASSAAYSRSSARSAGDGAASKSSTPAPAEPGAPTVLVIDDDADVRNLLSRHLGSQGFRVKTASSGAEGVHMARSIQPLAITLDVRMPDMDGWEALSIIKNDERIGDVPVIMLTIEDEGARGYRLGADDFLTKPINRQKLAGLMEKYREEGLGEGTVLVVEDNEDARSILRRTLESEGHEVREAANGREGLERLEEIDPSLILLDLMMPGMDGFEFLEEMRADEQYREVPVVVVTAKELSVEDRRYLSSKVEETLKKSEYTRGELLSEVEHRLSAVRTAHDADEGASAEGASAEGASAEGASDGEANAENESPDRPDASSQGEKTLQEETLQKEKLQEEQPQEEQPQGEQPPEEQPARDEKGETAPEGEADQAEPSSRAEEPGDREEESAEEAPSSQGETEGTGEAGPAPGEPSGEGENAVEPDAVEPDAVEPDVAAGAPGEDAAGGEDASKEGPTPQRSVSPAASEEDLAPEESASDAKSASDAEAPSDTEAGDAAAGEGEPLILLVEDNEHNYNMLSRRLRRRGYEVEIATDGQSGLDKAKSLHPALILMDINLPVLNGKEATRRIRALPEGADVPIIALTAHAMSGDREEALEAGCDRYHSKPVELPKLLEQMEELLGAG